MDGPPAYIGFDVGGQSIKAALLANSGEMLASSRCEVAADLTVEQLAGRLQSLLAELSSFAESRGVSLAGTLGLGLAGVLDRDGRLAGSPNLPELEGKCLGTPLAEALGHTLVIDNDVNCAALAEGWTGVAAGRDSFLVAAIGTGLGSGLVLERRLFHGSNGYGCEFGHLVVVPGGRRCGCGKLGCLEAYVSEVAARGMCRESGAALAGAVTELVASEGYGYARALFELAGCGNGEAEIVVSRMVELLGIALGSVVNLLDLNTLVLGGGIAPAFLARREQLLEAIDNALFARPVSMIELLEASGGPLSGAIGAARLAMEQHESGV